MAVREGYIATDIGMLPDGWSVKKLGELADIQRGASPRPIDSPQWFDVESDVGWVRITDVTQSKTATLTRTTEYLSTAGIANSRYLPSGSLIMSICATVGVPVITAINTCIHDGFVGFSKLRGVTKEYVYYVLKSLEKEFQSMGQTGSQSNLNSDLVRDRKVPVPPLPEQKAIAAALSDVDELVTNLEALIAKKQAIKQGAMQELLTGRKRLPGFEGEWEEKRLGEILSVRHGRSQHTVTAPDGKYPIFATGGEIGRSREFLYDKPSVLIGRKGTIDQPRYAAEPFWTIDTLFYTEIHAGNNPLFLFFVFQTIDWRSFNEASGVPSLNASTIENIQVFVPRMPEQLAIASTLSDIDFELAQLQDQLGKTRALKQGMMQELLTGRIRLA